MFKGKVVAFALMLVLATSVYAGDVDPCLSTIGIYPCAQMKMTICPGGDFEYWRTACGGTADYVWIECLGAGSVPIVGIPWTDYWMNACDAAKQLKLCISPFTADSLTGADGRTTFSGRVAGGGCTLSQGLWWAVQGKTILAQPGCLTGGTDKVCLDIIVKSPDLTGNGGVVDGIVNLLDLTPFGISFHKNLGQAGYNACCDYNDDDMCDLADFSFFGTHYQHRCPAS